MSQKSAAQGKIKSRTADPLMNSLLQRNVESAKCEENQLNIQRKVSTKSNRLAVFSDRKVDQRIDTSHKNFSESNFKHDFSRLESRDIRGGAARFRFQLSSSQQGENPLAVPAIVNDVLRDTGRSLDPDVRTYMESRFDFDFSQVRIHTNAKASKSALASNALAYTVGEDIVFGFGQYAPKTMTGKRLLAHELTHVVQQHNKNSPSTPLRTSVAGSSMEREADVVANSVAVDNSPLKVSQRADTRILSPWKGGFDITTRLPKSRDFSISSGTVTVECSASFSGPPSGAAACPSSSEFSITLWQKNIIFDSNHGVEKYPVPGTATHSWTELPSGTYYLEIYYPNTNPNCRVLGDLNVTT